MIFQNFPSEKPCISMQPHFQTQSYKYSTKFLEFIKVSSALFQQAIRWWKWLMSEYRNCGKRLIHFSIIHRKKFSAAPFRNWKFSELKLLSSWTCKNSTFYLKKCFVIFLKLKAKPSQVGKSAKKFVLTLQLERLKVMTRMVRILFITKDESCAKFQDCFIIRTLLHAKTVKKARNKKKHKV